MLDAKHKSSDTRGMNKLPPEKRVQILSMLVEGSSMRAISRVADVSINTVTKLLENAGEACITFHRSEEHTSELQSLRHLVCRLLLEKKKTSSTSADSAVTYTI